MKACVENGFLYFFFFWSLNHNNNEITRWIDSIRYRLHSLTQSFGYFSYCNIHPIYNDELLYLFHKYICKSNEIVYTHVFRSFFGLKLVIHLFLSLFNVSACCCRCHCGLFFFNTFIRLVNQKLWTYFQLNPQQWIILKYRMQKSEMWEKNESFVKWNWFAYLRLKIIIKIWALW